MDVPSEPTKVDFRFAGTEDTAEILDLVNDAFSVEKGDTALAFTSRDRVSAEEVDACLQGVSAEKRWLVLETPHPEERMVAAVLISTGNVPGTGSVEVLAVERSGQRNGIGSQMLRRAEGILLNFRCRFVRMKIPQWREDVLEWADKRGYKETGGGLWGELDGESAEDLTRPTRYFVMTRDLLTDTRLADTFGDGSARFAAATAAAKERAVAAADSKSAPNLMSAANPESVGAACEAEAAVPSGSVVPKGEKEDETIRLAGFLSSVLRGMTDAEEPSEGGNDAGSVKHDVAAPVVDVNVTTKSAATSSGPGELPHPPLPPATQEIQAADEAFSKSGAPDPSSPSISGQPALSAACASAAEGNSSANLICDGSGRHFEETCEPVASVDGEEKEESIENLLSSLMRTLNTTQGRADFGQLIAESSDN